MFVLNRLRGTYSWFAKINAIILGILFGFVTDSMLVGFFIASGYLIGESFGWGDWRGGILTGNHKCGDEGEKNGIKWLASKFYECGTKEYDYLALGIRGLYWWVPAFGSLYFIVDPLFLTVVILFLSTSLPICDHIASKIETPNQWGLSEYIQGGCQDVAIILLVASILI